MNNWTKDIPTVPGYYWARGKGCDPVMVELFAFVSDKTPDVVHFFNTDASVPLCEWGVGMEFYGPILPPNV